MSYARKNPDLFDKDEVLDHIKEEEITLEHYEYKAVECVNYAIDLLTESAQEKVFDYIDRGYESGEYCNHEILDGIDSREFASVVINEVKKSFAESILDPHQTSFMDLD